MKYKQVILIRSDLKLGKGKMVAQGSHASIYSMMISDENVVEEWLKEGMRKIVLKTDYEGILRLKETLRTNNIKSEIVYDFGLTQIDPHTATAIGIEIKTSEEIDKYIKDYRLL